jgi:predicted nucleic acid-binding protein
LLVLLGEVSCAGKQVHDANIVATMLVHGIDTIATMNAAGYARFSDHIAVLPFR